MRYDVFESREAPDQWRVEALVFETESEPCLATFSGSEAEERAREYAAWKNEQLIHESVR